MTLVGFTLAVSLVWAVVLVLDFAYCFRRGPAAIQRVGAGVLSSFASSAVLHLGLFIAFFGPVCNLLLQFLAEYVFDSMVVWVVSWTVEGLIVATMMIELLRTLTDGTWLHCRWISEDLKGAEDPQAHLDALVARIRGTAAEEPSKKAFLVLREISLRGDSMGQMVYNTLERNGLVEGLP